MGELLKYCGSCQDQKTLDKFGNNKSTKDGKQAYCRQCRAEIQRLSPEKQKERTKKYKIRNRDKILERGRIYAAKRREESKEHVYFMNRRSALKKNYGMTLEEYNDMLESQNGVCKICCGLNTHSNRGNLYVDHCHSTGKVRGLLCNYCNSGLGNARDRIDILEKMIIYLRGQF